MTRTGGLVIDMIRFAFGFLKIIIEAWYLTEDLENNKIQAQRKSVCFCGAVLQRCDMALFFYLDVSGEKYFSQGYNLDDGTYYFELQQWEPTASVIWSVKGLAHSASLDAFLKEPLFDGRTFWECEKEMERCKTGHSGNKTGYWRLKTGHFGCNEGIEWSS